VIEYSDREKRPVAWYFLSHKVISPGHSVVFLVVGPFLWFLGSFRDFGGLGGIWVYIRRNQGNTSAV